MAKAEADHLSPSRVNVNRQISFIFICFIGGRINFAVWCR
jgi:hypothetical protein